MGLTSDKKVVDSDKPPYKEDHLLKAQTESRLDPNYKSSQSLVVDMHKTMFNNVEEKLQ